MSCRADFIYSLAKQQLPTTNQNVNSTLLWFHTLQFKLLRQKNEAGTYETMTQGQNWPLTAGAFNYVQSLTCDGERRFLRLVPTNNQCKIRSGFLHTELSVCLIKATGEKKPPVFNLCLSNLLPAWQLSNLDDLLNLSLVHGNRTQWEMIWQA